VIDLQRLIESLPPRVARVVSGHELRTICANYNTLPPTEPVAPLTKEEMRDYMQETINEVRKTL
jgi:hypothetical protein